MPTWFKRSSIVPVLKTSTSAELNDYHPMALTSVVMNCFVSMIKNLICFSSPSRLDPNIVCWATVDPWMMSQILHTTLSHLNIEVDGFTTLLFNDYSLVIKTIVPLSLFGKLRVLGLCSLLWCWLWIFFNWMATHGESKCHSCHLRKSPQRSRIPSSTHTESILTGKITAWCVNYSAEDR